MKIYKPDFKKSIINVSATLSNFLGNKTDIKTLKVLEKELLKDYKNVVYICCDGLGVHPLKVNLDKHSFLRNNISGSVNHHQCNINFNERKLSISAWNVWLEFIYRKAKTLC